MVKRPSKNICERIHAKRRAYQRYGLSFNRKDYFNIINLIKTGKSKQICKQSNTRSIKKVNYNNIDLYLVYDKLRGEIATFLDENQVIESCNNYSLFD
jgi:hypothetical protein